MMITTHSARRGTWRLQLALVSALISLALVMPGSSVAQSQFASIGDTVFRDTDGDGIQDAGEPGIPGVIVRLTGMGRSTFERTDSSGNFLFERLAGGDYVIDVRETSTALSGLVATTPDPRDVTVGTGEAKLDVDFGFGTPGAIGDTVFRDLNGDGDQDLGEPGIAGVTVELRDSTGTTLIDSDVTDGNGKYGFEDVPAGDYLVDVDQNSPSLSGLFLTSVDPEPRSVSLAANAIMMDVDFGYDDTPSGRIGGTVFLDDDLDGFHGPGEPGINAVTVELKQFDGVTLASTETDADGNYSFEELLAGEYLVDVDNSDSQLDGLGPTTQEPREITVGADAERLGVDFGFDEDGDVDLAPNLTLPEKSAFAILEQGVSMLAAVIDRVGCAVTAGTYTFDVDANGDGSGSGTIDDATIVIPLPVTDNLRGTKLNTTVPVPGEIDDVLVVDLDGYYTFSRTGEIMLARSDFGLCVLNCLGPEFPGREAHDEHVIKDFLLDATQLPERVVEDQGLEVITKLNYPRMKFRQTSLYVPADGGLGFVEIEKVSIAPNNSPQCYIRYDAIVDDFGGGIQFIDGEVTVFPLL